MPWATWTGTEWAAFAAVATLLLFIVLVVATIYYAKQTKATVDELREARIVETLPVLHWQQPSCPSESTGTYYLAQLVLNLTNYGRGAARILAFSAIDDHGESFAAPGIALPSTLPAGERIAVVLSQRRAPRDAPHQRVITITLRFADAHGLRTYETRSRVTADWTGGDENRIVAFDGDERTPGQRRIHS
jgi:hypothetical protein